MQKVNEDSSGSSGSSDSDSSDSSSDSDSSSSSDSDWNKIKNFVSSILTISLFFDKKNA